MDGNTFTCTGIIAPIPNIVTPGDPAYSVLFPCTMEGINGTIDFESFNLYYTIQGPIGWALNIFRISGGPPGVLVTRVTKTPPRDYLILGSFFKVAAYEGVIGFDPAIVTIIDTYATPQTTYDFGLDTPVGTPNAARARAFLITQTLDTSPDPASPLPPVLKAAVKPTAILTLQCNGATKCYYPKRSRGCSDFSPTINIDAYSAAEDQNFGEAIFTVLDTKPHCGTINCKNKRVAPCVYESVFSQFPQINCILKGDGCSLRQKFLSIIAHYDLDTTIRNFTAHMALYVYAKYILSRLMYGDFSVRYLSRCLNERFLRDLEESAYSDFLFIFTDPEVGLTQFGRYFKCACDEKKCCD